MTPTGGRRFVTESSDIGIGAGQPIPTTIRVPDFAFHAEEKTFVLESKVERDGETLHWAYLDAETESYVLIVLND